MNHTNSFSCNQTPPCKITIPRLSNPHIKGMASAVARSCRDTPRVIACEGKRHAEQQVAEGDTEDYRGTRLPMTRPASHILRQRASGFFRDNQRPAGGRTVNTAPGHRHIKAGKRRCIHSGPGGKYAPPARINQTWLPSQCAPTLLSLSGVHHHYAPPAAADSRSHVKSVGDHKDHQDHANQQPPMKRNVS